MTEETIVKKLIELSEGKLSAQNWIIWFLENSNIIEKTCGRTVFLKMKTKESFSDNRNAYIGQSAVIDWLKTKNIYPEISNRYKNDWEKEFEDFCKSERTKEQNLKENVEFKFGYLKESYPKLFRQLQKSFSQTDLIGQGLELNIIEAKERELKINFSEDLKNFYLNISKFEFEGLNIDFTDLELEIINNQQYVTLGEYWKYGDGDRLLYHPKNQNVLVFAHEFRPPKIFTLAKTFKEFIEKEVVKHLKETES